MLVEISSRIGFLKMIKCREEHDDKKMTDATLIGHRGTL